MERIDAVDVDRLHRKIMNSDKSLCRDWNLLESAVSQPFTTFDVKDLYLTNYHKAAAICYNLLKNHAFLDGNKRIAHATMMTYLKDSWYNPINDRDDTWERILLDLANDTITREKLAEWLMVNHEPRPHILPLYTFEYLADGVLKHYEKLYERLAKYKPN